MVVLLAVDRIVIAADCATVVVEPTPLPVNVLLTRLVPLEFVALNPWLEEPVIRLPSNVIFVEPSTAIPSPSASARSWSFISLPSTVQVLELLRRNMPRCPKPIRLS